MSDDAELTEAAVAVLQTGLDDWVSLADLDAVAGFYGADDPARAELVEAVVRELAGSGLVRVGGLTRAGFSAFDVDLERAVGVVLGEYRNRGPAWPFNAWLDTTDAGDAAARRLPRARFLADEG